MAHIEVQELIPKLEDGSNFHNWRYRVELVIEARGLNDVLKTVEVKDENKRRDAEARSIIVQCLGDKFLSVVKECKSAMKMLVALENTFTRKSVMNKYNLKKKLTDLKCDSNEKLQDFFCKFDKLINDNENISKMDESDKVVHLLLALPEKYNNVTTALETMNEDLTLEKTKRILLDAEIRLDVLVSQKHENAFNIECWVCNEKGHKSIHCRKNFTNRQDYNPQRGIPVRGREFHRCGRGRWQSRGQGGIYRATTSRDDAIIGEEEAIKEMGCMIDEEFNLNCKAFIDNSSISFVVDSGASQNFITDGYVQYMTNITKLEQPITIKTANGDKVIAYHSGKLPVKFGNTRITIQGLIVSNLAYNLLSVRKLLENPNEIVFKRGYAKITFFEGSTIWAYNNGKLYILQGKIVAVNGDAALYSADDGMLWHRRLGHTSTKTLQRLQLPAYNKICNECMKGKATRLPFKPLEQPRSRQVLELIHSDIAGPSNIPTILGEIYFQTIIDDYSHFCVVFLLKRKAEAAENIIKYIQRYENEFEKTVKRIRCDNAGEYTCNQLRQFCGMKGISLEYSLPYSPASNGVAERMNRSLYNKARVMLIETKLPKSLWGEATKCAAYQLNRCTSKAIDFKTPCEVLYGRRDLSKLRAFGAKAWACILPKPDKFSERARECRMVGYARTGYNLWDPTENKIIVSRDVRFDEGDIVYNESNQMINENDVLRVRISETNLNSDPNAETGNNNEGIRDEVIVDNTHIEDDVMEPEEVFEDCTNEVLIERSDIINENEIRTRSGRIVRPPKRLEDYETHVAYCLCTGDPVSYKEAVERGQKWQQAINKELDSLKCLGTWEKTVLPNDKKAIDTKWIFTTKKDGTKKARLVAKGFQEETLFNVYSPVARMPTIRMMLSQAVQNEMYMKQLDVPTAFLNGLLKEDVYIKPPQGVKIDKGFVLKLKRSLYGLKQAPKCWNERLHSFLVGIGFIQSKHDFCLYSLEGVFLLVYVDDIILMSKSGQNLNQIYEHLKSEFNVKDLGEISTYLGLEIVRTTEQISISQESSIDRLLAKYNMTDCKGAETPMEVNFTTNDSEPIALDVPYRELIGCLLYLATSSRPDICFAVSFLSRYLDKPTISLWKAAKRVLRYLKQTKSKSLIYKRDGNNCVLVGYTDADWAGDKIDRKSVSGALVYYGYNLLSWFCKKQNVVALSTAEAEYIAAALASAELVYLRGLLQDFTCPSESILRVDNQSAIKLMESNENSKRSKHIDIKYHFVKDLVNKKEMIVKYVNTNENVADILTKALGKLKHNYFMQKLGFN